VLINQRHEVRRQYRLPWVSAVQTALEVQQYAPQQVVLTGQHPPSSQHLSVDAEQHPLGGQHLLPDPQQELLESLQHTLPAAQHLPRQHTLPDAQH
jgi:hypothetical protein